MKLRVEVDVEVIVCRGLGLGRWPLAADAHACQADEGKFEVAGSSRTCHATAKIWTHSW